MPLAPKCISESCQLIASKKNWPKATRKEDALLFNLGPVKFRLSPNPTEVIALPMGMATLRYGEKSIVVHRQSVETVNELAIKGLFDRASFTITDIPKIVFTHAANETEPVNRSDRFLWRYAMFLKQTHFEGTDQLMWVERAGLRVFYGLRKGSNDNVVMFITQKQSLSEYLQVVAFGYSLSEFEKQILPHIFSYSE